MTKMILTLAVLALSNQAFAGLKCSIEGEEDYSVEVNAKADKAAFFDNNDWSVVPATAALGVFKGRDYTGAPLLIKIDFTEGMVQHHAITFDVNGRAKTAAMACVYADDADLNSGI